MKRLIGIPLAALLLIGGATAVLAQSGAGAAVVQAVAGPGTVLGDVLADLVGDGVITQDQADAITKAVDDRRAEMRQQAEARREEMRALREQIRTFLEDGTLSADELAQLPEDHPLRNLDRYLEDGQLTQDELRQLRGFGGFGRGLGPGGGHGFGHGPGRWGAPPADDGGTQDDSGVQGSSS